MEYTTASIKYELNTLYSDSSNDDDRVIIPTYIPETESSEDIDDSLDFLRNDILAKKTKFWGFIISSFVVGGSLEAVLYVSFNPINPQAGWFYDASHQAATSTIPFGIGTAIICTTVAAVVIKSVYELCYLNKIDNMRGID